MIERYDIIGQLKPLTQCIRFNVCGANPTRCWTPCMRLSCRAGKSIVSIRRYTYSCESMQPGLVLILACSTAGRSSWPQDQGTEQFPQIATPRWEARKAVSTIEVSCTFLLAGGTILFPTFQKDLGGGASPEWMVEGVNSKAHMTKSLVLTRFHSG